MCLLYSRLGPKHYWLMSFLQVRLYYGRNGIRNENVQLRSSATWNGVQIEIAIKVPISEVDRPSGTTLECLGIPR